MLREGDIVEIHWKVGRLLLDDGLASYFATIPVGPSAPDPPPTLLLRAVDAGSVGDVIKTWPIVSPQPLEEGIPERLEVGDEGSRVLVDVFSVQPGLPSYEHGKALPPREALECFLDACKIVDAYHKERWVLRTLNPHAFFRSVTAEGLWIFPPTCLWRAGNPLKSVVGTPGYVAPEAWKPEKADPAMDVYGLGAVLYAWLSGKDPFAEAEDVEAVVRLSRVGSLPDLSVDVEAVPPSLAHLIQKATTVHPLGRFRKVSDLARAARDVLTDIARAEAQKSKEREAKPPAREERPEPAGEDLPSQPVKRKTQILPFSLSDIIEETEGQR
jgi:serine/threonine protein kinase